MTSQKARAREEFYNSLNTDKILSILEITNSLLLEDDIKVLNNRYGNIAYTIIEDKTIYLNLMEIALKTKNSFLFMVLLKALNYHELGHNKFTDYNKDLIA
jgi:hypothetical protein